MSRAGGYVIAARTILKIVFGYFRHDGRLVEFHPLVGGQIYWSHLLMARLMELRVQSKDDSSRSSLLIVVLVVMRLRSSVYWMMDLSGGNLFP